MLGYRTSLQKSNISVSAVVLSRANKTTATVNFSLPRASSAGWTFLSGWKRLLLLCE